MTTAKITRRSIVGFGYTSDCEQAWNKSMTSSWLRVCDVTRPDYTGTIKQVNEAIEADRALASFNGGTSYNTAWFVRVGKEWKKIVDEYASYKLSELTYNCGMALPDSVTVEIES